MKMPEGIIVKDKKTGTFFGFIARFPGVWAQGNSKEEVYEKIEKVRIVFIKRLETMRLEMREEHEYEM
jgi:predicted RNase H-like HicB family nuclease